VARHGSGYAGLWAGRRGLRFVEQQRWRLQRTRSHAHQHHLRYPPALTGPAAPGYSEIAPASQAFFDYVNAHGGVYGRKIHLIIKDDAYNPTETVTVVHQLVLQDNVFGIFEGLGTPTHTKVVGFLNASKVPDIFVASGCPCWDNGASQPYTFGWQPNYTIEGKILGQYIKQHFAGKKIGVLYQDDDFGKGGLTGIGDEVPASDIVAKEPYQSGVTSLAAQVTAIKAAKATVMVDFTVPIYTAIAQLTSFTLGYKPQLVVSNVGIDPTTVGGLLKSISKGKASGTALIEGAITDGYIPSSSDLSNPWIALFKKIHDQYDSSAPFDGNVEYGMANAYTLVQALQAAGKKLTRQGLVKAIEQDGAKWTGPGLVPFPLRDDRARGLQRRRDGTDPKRQDRPLRGSADDRTHGR
jgi:ABC-type branched-subunit amino acid transport system substrate-binding protein